MLRRLLSYLKLFKKLKCKYQGYITATMMVYNPKRNILHREQHKNLPVLKSLHLSNRTGAKFCYSHQLNLIPTKPELQLLDGVISQTTCWQLMSNDLSHILPCNRHHSLAEYIRVEQIVIIRKHKY